MSELSIWLPASYESSEQTYPTLYVLDAPIFIGSMVWNAFIQNVDADVPEMIVVGIGKRTKNLDEWWPIRARDYSPVSYPGEPDLSSDLIHERQFRSLQIGIYLHKSASCLIYYEKYSDLTGKELHIRYLLHSRRC